jgi:ATP-binding cassette subfamily B protein
MPLPLKLVVDNVLDSQPLPQILGAIVPAGIRASPLAMLWFAILLLVLLGVLKQVLGLGSWILREYLGEKIILEFRSKLFEHVTQFSLAQHDVRPSGDLTYRVQYDAPALKWLVMDGAVFFLSAILTLIGMVYVVALLDHRLALVALLIVPVIFTLTRIYSPRLRENWRHVKTFETSALSIVQQALGAIRVVKAFGQENREQKRLIDVSRQGILERIRVITHESQFDLLVGITIAVGTASVLFIGAEAVRAGQMTTGDLLLVMSYIAQLYDPVQTMGKQIAAQQGSLASAERAFSILDEVPSVKEAVDATPLRRTRGHVAFSRVTFAYDKRRPALWDINFVVSPGMTVGIIGKTGAGKTTLVSLLTRFYDPTEGVILLDGQDIKAYRLADLRNQFSLVLQEPVLFPTTIGENIAYGVPGACESAIIAAAKAANAHEFISALPDGYDTVVGERGAMLSGGERQRISLARAFIKDSSILILDEPTSSVDMETEKAIMEATLRLIAGRTTFIIAHRRATLHHCELLLVLDDGRLIDVVDSPQTALQDFALDGKGEWRSRRRG